MTCDFDTIPGAIICSRTRSGGTCATCGTKNPSQECDGCDKKLCPACSVSPRRDLDFCPRCASAAFSHWLHGEGKEYNLPASELVGSKKTLRRMAFRIWATVNKVEFFKLIGFTKTCTAQFPCVICAAGGESCKTA